VCADRRVKRCAVRGRSGRNEPTRSPGMAFRGRALRAAARPRSRSGCVLPHRRPSGRGRRHSQALAEGEVIFSSAPGVGGGGETVNPGLRSPSALGEIIGRGARPWHLATAADFRRGRRPVFRRPGFPCKAARPNLRTLRERLRVRAPLRRFRVPATRKVESADVGRPGGWRAVGKAARS